MNKNRIYRSFVGLAVAGLTMSSLTGCMDVTEPTTVATEEQIQGSSASAEAMVMAVPATMNEVDGGFIDNYHNCFGYSAMMYIRDLMTGDLCQTSSGYAFHFYYWARNKYQGDGYIFPQYINQYYFGLVLAANNVVGSVNPETASDKQLGYLGVGLAYRALAYLDMARMYEYLPTDVTSNINVDGNDVKGLTVPIVRETTDQEAALNNPRVSHEEMYKFIEEDLNNAEKYIVNLTDTKGKVLPSLGCVYGLKARLYMWNEEYAKAEEYARKAINAAGVSPMTEADCTSYTKGFNDISKWMWGEQLTSESDQVKTGIVNWVSWLSNQTTFGYTGVNSSDMPFNMIDRSMYDRMSDTDFRKYMYKAPEGSSIASKNIYIPSIKDLCNKYMPSYASLKFRPANGNATDSQAGAASAYPVMRVEEMYFIEAEAAAHQDAARGKQLLEQFMKTYRDPNYSCKVSSTDAVVEEIVFQKRVELWGEGQTFFDIKRLNYSVTRGYPGTNWYEETRFNTNGRPAWMNLTMVRNEANNNQALVGWNNPDPSDKYPTWKENN